MTIKIQRLRVIINLVGFNRYFIILLTVSFVSSNVNAENHKILETLTIIIIEKKPAHVRSCYCSCMAGMSETCNHVAAAMFRIEGAVRLGLTNPASTSTANEWLPCHKEVAPGLRT